MTTNSPICIQHLLEHCIQLLNLRICVPIAHTLIQRALFFFLLIFIFHFVYPETGLSAATHTHMISIKFQDDFAFSVGIFLCCLFIYRKDREKDFIGNSLKCILYIRYV